MRATVVLAKPMIDPAGPAFLSERYDLIELESLERLPEVLPHADAVFVRQDSPLDARSIALGTRLKVIACSGAGYQQVDMQAASDAGILVTRAGRVGARAVAEHTVGMMLSLAKRIPWTDRMTREGNFEVRWLHPGFEEITGRTIAIVGWGEIGRDVASICRGGFQMRVLAVTKPGAPPVPADEAEHASLEAALAQADVVSVHVPLTPQTQKMFGAREFGLMRPGSWFVNTSRGKVVDEAALLEALRGGRIAGAALDVFDPEPPAKDNPLLALDSVIVTPHNAGMSAQARYKLTMLAAEEIDAVLSGRRPKWLLNPEVWPRSRAVAEGDRSLKLGRERHA